MSTLTLGKAEILTQTETEERFQQDGLKLTNEAGLFRKNPPWHLCDEVVRNLIADGRNRYCILEVPGYTYIQAWREAKGFCLEWRITNSSDGSYTHCRAGYFGKHSESAELATKTDYEDRDVISLEDTLDAFYSFYGNCNNMPGWLEWVKLDI